MAPNALFKVLFHSKMRKTFVFQYFCDAGIENIMNSRGAVDEDGTRHPAGQRSAAWGKQ